MSIIEREPEFRTRDPLPHETLLEYIERVIMGWSSSRRMRASPFFYAGPTFIEPSYVFAPYVAMVVLAQAIRGSETTHQ